jgi:hypothetical protein
VVLVARLEAIIPGTNINGVRVFVVGLVLGTRPTFTPVPVLGLRSDNNLPSMRLWITTTY